MMLAIMVQVGFVVHQVSFLFPVLGREGAGLALFLTALMAATSRVVVGFFIDRLDQRTVGALLLAAQASSLLAMLKFPSPHVAYLASAVFGFAVGVIYFSFHPFRGTKRAGPRVRLPGYPANADGTPNAEWWAAYRAASGIGAARPGAGTFTALIAEYQQSPEWKALALATRKEWKRHLRLIEASCGGLQAAGVEPKHVVKLRDSRASTPADANNLLRVLSALFTWGALRGWRGDNPCRLVPKLKIGDGWAPWPWDAIGSLPASCPEGSVGSGGTGARYGTAVERRARHGLD
jgi:hypothetical protein